MTCGMKGEMVSERGHLVQCLAKENRYEQLAINLAVVGDSGQYASQTQAVRELGASRRQAHQAGRGASWAMQRGYLQQACSRQTRHASRGQVAILPLPQCSLGRGSSLSAPPPSPTARAHRAQSGRRARDSTRSPVLTGQS